MPSSSASIEAVRRFNRFYTREVGVLRKSFLDTPWSLGEMRVLFEIANGEAPSASDIARQLDLCEARTIWRPVSIVLHRCGVRSQ